MSPATSRALVGASTATAAGAALGIVARAARATHTDLGRSAPARLARALADRASQLDAASLDAASLARVAVAALLLVAATAGGRALVLWLRARPSTRRSVAGRVTSVVAAAVRARHTPAAPVHALADRGLARAEIARRTGLSQDAILLAMYLK